MAGEPCSLRCWCGDARDVRIGEARHPGPGLSSPGVACNDSKKNRSHQRGEYSPGVACSDFKKNRSHQKGG
eukprot:896886-Alexandrium_andersonii.AAC.1